MSSTPRRSTLSAVFPPPPAAPWPQGAGSRLKRTHLELGGNAPAMVFADADLEAAAETIAVVGYFNAGQDDPERDLRPRHTVQTFENDQEAIDDANSVELGL